MSDLVSSRCKACEGGATALSSNEIIKLLNQLNQWEYLPKNSCLYKKYSFKNYYETMAFVNAIAWIAHQENHHPDLQIGYNYCTVNFTTHAVRGVTENDFICAAKIDSIMLNQPTHPAD